MENFFVKLLTLFILLLCNLLTGLIPLIVVRAVSRLTGGDRVASQRNRVLSFFLHMGGGVFMSVCLLILMPEAREQFEQHAERTPGSGGEEHHEEFPIPEFVILCGFFATFAVEEALHYILYHCRRRNTSTDRRVRFCSCAKRHTECSRTFKAENPEQTLFGLEKNGHGEYARSNEQVPSTNLLRSSIISQPVPNYGTVADLTDSRTHQPVTVLTAPVVIAANNGDVAIVHRLHDFSSPVTTSTSNILLVLALSLYAISQGTHIGLLTKSSPWTMLLVACFQQAIVVFIVGWVGLSQSELLLPVMSYIAVLSAMSPFGISLSMFLERGLSAVPPIACGVAKALVCGALLYLTFCDLLRRRKLKESPHIERFAGFTLGAAAMAALQYISIII